MQNNQRLLPILVLVAFALCAFVLSGSGDWIPRLVVVASAVLALGLVLRVTLASLDQRRSGWVPVLAALPVWLLPPLLVVATYGTFLDTRSIMRILLLLNWSVLALVLWVAFERVRRRSDRHGANSVVAVSVSVASVLVAIVPPFAGLGSVGRPQTVGVTTASCVGAAPADMSSVRARLVTARGEEFRGSWSHGEWVFEGVPYYATYRFSAYLPPSQTGYRNLQGRGLKVLDDGSLEIEVDYLLIEPTYGYVDTVAAIFSGGLLQDDYVSGMDFTMC
jgi:hypothetical protein